MMNEQEKLLKYLTSVEKMAQEIICNKREIIMLDKIRNQNREALRGLSNSVQSKAWITVGSVLVKNDIEHLRSLLEADQKKVNVDINKLRSELKVKVNNLRDLEMQPPVPGLMLVPMTQKETHMLSQSGLF